MSIREFDTGATRDTDDGKLDFEGFLSPLALERYAQYMHKHRRQSDGGMRDSDNWQKGIPLDAYMKSGWRHFRDWWREHRGYDTDDGIEESLCALIFNAMGYLHELESRKQAVREMTRDAQLRGEYDDAVIPPPPEYNPDDYAFPPGWDRHDRVVTTINYRVNLCDTGIGDVPHEPGIAAETAYLARFGPNDD